ncbi:MAG: Ankyrin repeat domain-containing protein 17, partial [Marteilia pararefringens]
LMNTKGKKKILKQIQVSNICSKTFIQEYQDDPICDDDSCESRVDPQLTPFSDISKTEAIYSLSKLKEEADSIQTYDLNSTVSDSFDNPLYPINIKSLLKASDLKHTSFSPALDNNHCSPKNYSSTNLEHLVEAIDQDIIDCSLQDMFQMSNEQLYTMKDINHIKEETKVPVDGNLTRQISVGPESNNEQSNRSNCTPKSSPDNYEIDKKVNTPTDIPSNKSMTANNSQCADELSEINEDINLDITMPKSQDTPLSIACAKGFEDTVSLLIGHGVNLEHRNKRGFTPLMLAAEHDHLNVLKLLIKHGAQIDQETERSKDNALGVACASGSVKCAKFLIKYLTNRHLSANNAMLVSPLDHVNSTDYTPLCFAASGGHFEICELLIESGALVDGPSQTAKIGITPLMLATMQNHVDVATYLIECGASVNTKIETNKNSILSFAISQNHSKIAKLLLERGANLEHRSKSGFTPLMEACENSNLEIVSLLVDYGADCNSVSLQSPRDSVLTIAASQANNLDIVTLLVKTGGANVEYRNKKGANAFWIACSHGFIEIVKFLAPVVKCDIHVNDFRGVSPIFVAFKGGHIEIVEYLSKIVSQFPRDEDVLQYVNTFKLNNGNTDDEQDSKYYQELLKNMEESMKIIFQAKEKMNLKSVNCLSAFLKTFDQSEKQNQGTKHLGKRSRKKKQRCLKSENAEIISILSHKSPVTATVDNSSKFSDDKKKHNDKLDHDYLKIATNQDIQEDNTHNKPLFLYEDNRDKMEFQISVISESQDDRAKPNMHEPSDVFHNKRTRRKNCRKSLVTNKIHRSPSPNTISPPAIEKTYPIIKKQLSNPQNVTQIPNSDNLSSYSSQSSAKKDLDNSTIKYLTKSISPFAKNSQNSKPRSPKNSAKDANTNSELKCESIRMHEDQPPKSSHTPNLSDMKNEERDNSSSVDKSNELFGYRPKKYGRFVDLLTNQNFSIYSPHPPANQSKSSDPSENTHNAAMKSNTEISSLFSTTKFSEENILQNIESFKYIEDLISPPEIQNNTKNFGKQSEENSIVEHAGPSSIHAGYDQAFAVNSHEQSSQTNIQFPSA